jgi:hypothetical protein
MGRGLGGWLSYCARLFGRGTLVLFLAGRAHGAELLWTAPDECPTPAEVERQLAEILETPVAEAAPVLIEIAIRRVPQAGMYQARIRFLTNAENPSPGTERVLEGNTCATAGDAALVAVALALASKPTEAPSPSDENEAFGARKDGPEASTQRIFRSSPAPAPEPDPASTREGAPRAPTRWAVEAGLLGDWGSLPDVGAGAELGLRLSSGHRALRATLLAFPKSSLAVAAPRGGSVALLAASFAGCTGRAAGDFEFVACGGAELGRMEGHGTGVTQPGRGSAWWLAPRGDVSTSWGSADLRVWLRAGVVLPLNRPAFVLDGEAVHQPNTIALRLGAGLEVRLD